MGTKYTIDDMHAIAKERGGKCLSQRYVNSKTKLKWECSEGHKWESKSVQNGTWCRKCSSKQTGYFSINDMQSLAKKHGGKCLSKEYVNAKTKMKWQCKEGHKWETTYDTVQQGAWCLICRRAESGKRRQIGLEPFKKIAEERGGELLSEKYLGVTTPHKWKCSCGHIWMATPDAIKNSGTWCPKCGGRMRKTIEDMQAIAKKYNGRCLSKRYKNQDSILLWECAEGHRWRATSGNILNSNAWCPRCAGKNRTIQDMRRLARSRGGKCLSKEYVTNPKKLSWECKNGHRFENNSASINSGQWCPECSTGVSERICRSYFQQIFGHRFPNVRPKWLRNEAGNLMELDGYCKGLRLAFEHQGSQHYETGFYSPTKKGLSKRIRDDQEKARLCDMNGVRLIAIPELFSKTKLVDLQQFIYEECKRLKVRRPKGFLSKKINLASAYSTPGSIAELHLIQKIAKSKGGRLVSKHYVHALHPHKWECEHGHRWEATPAQIKHADTWCAVCAGNVPLTIKDMQAIAKKHGGKCLSKKYKNASAQLRWECKEGHKWSASAGGVRHAGSWCPKCSRKKAGLSRRLGIDHLHSLAKKFGGKCLSEEYDSVYTKYLWECKKGHQWHARIGDMKRKKICCPECRPHKRESSPNRLTIEEMQKIAKKHCGKCLSTEYVNSKEKLHWECSEGHKWLSTPGNIKSGKWCPKCAQKRAGKSRSLGIEAMHQLAKSRGGKCLSKTYVNGHTKLKWQCEQGHKWESTPLAVKHNGSWCPECAKERAGKSQRLTIEEMQKIAKDRKGKCVSEEYTNSNTHLIWECQKGHQWKAKPGNIKTGKWCPKCAIEKNAAKRRLGIDEMHEIAMDNGGKCLSNKYINSESPLKWECSKGHQWMAPPQNVKNAGSWCSICAGNKKGTIEEMNIFAEDRGGKCLSKIYVDGHKKLKWECANGHQWLANPIGMRSKDLWCQQCKSEETSLRAIEEMQKLASSHQGRCLSETYTRADRKLQWECSKGHKWLANRRTVEKGIWCKTCLKESKLHELQVIAKSKKGKCLSKKYATSHTKMKWECSKGHQWQASANLIQNRGNWCRICSTKSGGLRRRKKSK